MRPNRPASDAPGATSDLVAPQESHCGSLGVPETSQAVHKSIVEPRLALPGPGRDPRIAPKEEIRVDLLGFRSYFRISAWTRAGPVGARLSTCGVCGTFLTPPVAGSDFPEVPQGHWWPRERRWPVNWPAPSCYKKRCPFETS